MQYTNPAPVTLYPPALVREVFASFVRSHGGELSAIDQGYTRKGCWFYSLCWNHDAKRWGILAGAWPDIALRSVFVLTIPEASLPV